MLSMQRLSARPNGKRLSGNGSHGHWTVNMKTLETLEPLTTRLLEIQRIASASAVLAWDQETYMPSGGGAARAEQLATLQGLTHQKLVAPEIETLLRKWIDPEKGQAIDNPGDAWDEPSRAVLREAWRDFSRAKNLPSEFVVRLSRECSLSQQAWAKARAHNSFKDFLPHLRTVIELKRQQAEYLGYTDSPYDALLDEFEPGATAKFLAPLFEHLRSHLVDLLRRVIESPVKIEDGFLYQTFDTNRQLEFGRLVLEKMGYDFHRGRMDLSTHPFTTSFHPTDVRVTTRVHAQELSACLFGCIHEGGHGLYEMGLDPKYYGTPLGEAGSLGIHESQSRLWENCVGRSMAFWRFFYPQLQRTFPDQLNHMSVDQFYPAINRVKPSLIRVEADELTYNLHIMLRFEIEQALIENQLQPEELPEIWRDRMRRYIGIEPQTDAEGALQDIHWSMGAFGYFPTYTLGNLYAAAFMDQAKREMPQLESEIASGQLLNLRQWLHEKIHKWGRMFRPEELARRVTGSGLTVEPYIEYIQKKYSEIYQLKRP